MAASVALRLTRPDVLTSVAVSDPHRFAVVQARFGISQPSVIGRLLCR